MMGMGEPLQNYGALLPALRVMLDDHGYGLSRRRVTVSTSGVVPMIDRLRDDCPVALAVSLHAPDDALRDQLVPLNRKYPLHELLRRLRALPRRRAARLHHLRVLHARWRQRFDRAGARAGAPGARPRAVQVQSDSVQSVCRTRACSVRRASAWRRLPTCCRVPASSPRCARTRGDDIAAACGQLAGEVRDRTRVAQRLARGTIRLVPALPARR